MFGILKSLISVAVPIVKLFLNKEEGEKVTVAEALPFAVGQLLPAVQKAIEYGKLTTVEQVDAWLDTVDAATGDDVTAVDLIKSMPDDKEELFFDHIKEAVRIYAYCLLKVPGYRVE